MKTALGITKAKRRLARATGIPTTKTGRKRKAYNAISGGAYGKYQRTRAAVNRPFKYHKNPHSCLGCLISIITPILLLVIILILLL